MEQVVYGDVLFIINFSMDLFALYICGSVLHKRIKPLPLSLAAAAGGIYAVAKLFFESPTPLVFDVAAAILMCMIAYGIVSFANTLGEAFLFFVCEMLLGGVFTALYNLIGRGMSSDALPFDEIGARESDIPLWMFALLAILSGALTYIGGRIMGRSTKKKRVGIKIEAAGRVLALDALVDSGNLLTEPISGRAVVIVTYKMIKDLLPYEIREIILENKVGSTFSAVPEKSLKIRLVPYETVGERSMLVGFVPDKMVIYDTKKKNIVNAVVAIDTKSEDFGGCGALVPSALINI